MIAEDDGIRRPRLTRDRYLLGFLCSLALLGLVTAAVFDGPAPDVDTVIGGLVILSVASIPSVFTAARTVHWGLRVRRRRNVIAAATAAGKLPPAPDSWVPPGAGDPEPVARLRVLAWRASGIVVLWLTVLAVGIVGLDQLSRSAQHLLDIGTRVTGTVLDVSRPAKGYWTIDVRYPGGAGPRTAVIYLDVNREIEPGQEITVVYDPADPARVRTLDDENSNQFLVSAFVIPLLVALVVLPFAVAAAAGWFFRRRSVRRTGWHRADVVVTRVYRGSDKITATYPDGSEVELRSAISTHSASRRAGIRPQRAWIGGEAKTMVMLFPGDETRKPYAAPVSAKKPRVA
ncbi:DUF3592 domain-containing protein [Amycolatopsis sp. GM8]|uniref:DUF3592 domain-containing protein n=1 Tax=Amycolatopsis sp. GM8 TaxID=2896530 RepID=UPI001F1A03C2|nr:DUF3592 domain-containing protein [Amycolatopsis sp. GM8]